MHSFEIFGNMGWQIHTCLPEQFPLTGSWLSHLYNGILPSATLMTHVAPTSEYCMEAAATSGEMISSW